MLEVLVCSAALGTQLGLLVCLQHREEVSVQIFRVILVCENEQAPTDVP